MGNDRAGAVDLIATRLVELDYEIDQAREQGRDEVVGLVSPELEKTVGL